MNIADESRADDGEWGELSLEELGRAYANVVDKSGLRDADEDGHAAALPGIDEGKSEPFANDDIDDAVPTLSAIVEGALFIGHPDGRAIRESELAALMRDVSVEDIAQEIDRLNEQYKQHHQAFRVLRDDDGIRLGVAPDLETVRRAFYGKVRETTLSQGAVEVLALVAYQPGITAEKVQTQRGQESASLLNQLVRRRLLELRRVGVEEGRRAVSTYYPTERFLHLFSLESLEDLPHVEE